jgi:hypothetical protein
MQESNPLSHPHGRFGVVSEEDMGAKHYGCFSPHGGDILLYFPASPAISSTIEGGAIAVVVASMLEIMPELWELCLSPTLPLSEEHMKVDSSAIDKGIANRAR